MDHHITIRSIEDSPVVRDGLKRVVNRSKSAVVVFKIYDNWRLRRQLKSGNIETLHGATHSRKNVEESIAYINAQFADYLNYADLNAAGIAGTRILELGFGDNLGVALKFIAAGALSVVCLDRFYSQRDQEHQLEIYRALRETLNEDEKGRFDAAITLKSKIETRDDVLRCIYGTSLDEARDDLMQQYGAFDLIISRAVLEEIYEPDSTFAAMAALTRTGGCLAHKIDLTDYGIFRDRGMHPLTFLTIPESIYRLMATDSGIPNRRLIGYYRKRMSELGFDAKLFVTSVVGVGALDPHLEKPKAGVDYSQATIDLIDQIRPKLSGEFRGLPDEDLLVEGIFLVARKEGARN